MLTYTKFKAGDGKDKPHIWVVFSSYNRISKQGAIVLKKYNTKNTFQSDNLTKRIWLSFKIWSNRYV